MSLAGAREFLLGAYHDLPNVLFMGSLVMGSILGYLPLVWVSLGLILNGGVVSLLQGLLRLLFPTWDQVSIYAGSPACEVLGRTSLSMGPVRTGGTSPVAPSHWLSAASFFSAFVVYNSIKVAGRGSARGASAEKVSARQAFSLSVAVVGLAFMGIVLARGYSGCETWLGGATGIVVGILLAISYWQFLDLCGTGKGPDVLQVTASLEPVAKDSETPIVCAAQPDPTASNGSDCVATY